MSIKKKGRRRFLRTAKHRRRRLHRMPATWLEHLEPREMLSGDGLSGLSILRGDTAFTTSKVVSADSSSYVVSLVDEPVENTRLYTMSFETTAAKEPVQIYSLEAFFPGDLVVSRLLEYRRQLAQRSVPELSDAQREAIRLAAGVVAGPAQDSTVYDSAFCDVDVFSIGGPAMSGQAILGLIDDASLKTTRDRTPFHNAIYEGLLDLSQSPECRVAAHPTNIPDDLGSIGLLFGDQIRQDLASEDSEVRQRASAAHDAILSNTRSVWTLWSGLGSTPVEQRHDAALGTSVHTSFYESGVLELAEGINVRFDQPAFVKLTQTDATRGGVLGARKHFGHEIGRIEVALRRGQRVGGGFQVVDGVNGTILDAAGNPVFVEGLPMKVVWYD